MTSQVRNLWCRSQNKMGPSSKFVSSQHIFCFVLKSLFILVSASAGPVFFAEPVGQYISYKYRGYISTMKCNNVCT